jgi:hypothetical protein
MALAAAVALVLLAASPGARSETPSPSSQALDETKRIASDIQRLTSALEEAGSKQDLLLQAMLSDKVDEITEGKESDQEICLAVARWISANIANRTAGTADPYETFATRSGLCGSRARLFVEMVGRKNIIARIFNMYNFGYVGGGHSCAQAYYDGQWRFFDVTYAGVFMRDGKVLSWNEIVADPAAALENMVVFEKTIDSDIITLEDDPFCPKVQNRDRVDRVYTMEALSNARSAGFLGFPDIKTLYVKIDAAGDLKNPILLGKIDRSGSDVNAAGVAAKLTENLAYTLHTLDDYYHTQWQFVNLKPGATYVLRYHLYSATSDKIAFWARAERGKIISGGSFTAPATLGNNAPQTWEIVFQAAEDGSCAFLVGYDFRDKGVGVLIDAVEIRQTA